MIVKAIVSLYEKITTKMRVSFYCVLRVFCVGGSASKLDYYCFCLQLSADDLVLMSETIEDLQRNEDQHQQNKINGEWNRRKNIKKQNKFVWQGSDS